MGWDGSPGGRRDRAPYGANNVTDWEKDVLSIKYCFETDQPQNREVFFSSEVKVDGCDRAPCKT